MGNRKKIKKDFENKYGVLYIPKSADIENSTDDIYTFEKIESLCKTYYDTFDYFKNKYSFEEFVEVVIGDLYNDFPEKTIKQLII